MGDSSSKGHYEMYYSRVDQEMYWVNSDTHEIEKQWPCKSAFLEGIDEVSKLKRDSLPIDDYGHCHAETVGNTEEDRKKYGTFYISTGDKRGRDIHGGGSGCSNPCAPEQGWCPTYGCLRMQNKDGEELSRLMVANGNDIHLHVQQEHLDNITLKNDLDAKTWQRVARQEQDEYGRMEGLTRDTDRSSDDIRIG